MFSVQNKKEISNRANIKAQKVRDASTRQKGKSHPTRGFFFHHLKLFSEAFHLKLNTFNRSSNGLDYLMGNFFRMLQKIKNKKRISFCNTSTQSNLFFINSRQLQLKPFVLNFSGWVDLRYTCL